MTPKSVLSLPEEVRWQGRDDVQLRALAVNGYASDLSGAISLAVEAAHQSPCQKSKRGGVAFARRRMYQPPDPVGRMMTVFETGHNQPAQSLFCSGTEICKSSCRHICDHAEAIVVSKWLAKHGSSPEGSAMFDVVHIELRPNEAGAWEPVTFDREGQPKGPSCITCARDMLRALDCDGKPSMTADERVVSIVAYLHAVAAQQDEYARKSEGARWHPGDKPGPHAGFVYTKLLGQRAFMARALAKRIARGDDLIVLPKTKDTTDG